MTTRATRFLADTAHFLPAAQRLSLIVEIVVGVVVVGGTVFKFSLSLNLFPIFIVVVGGTFFQFLLFR